MSVSNGINRYIHTNSTSRTLYNVRAGNGQRSTNMIGYFLASFFLGWGVSKLMLYFKKMSEVVIDD